MEFLAGRLVCCRFLWIKYGIANRRVIIAFWRCHGWKPVSTRLVAVLFADEPLELDWINLFADSGFYGVMLDTADKHAGGLRTHCNEHQLREFVRRARDNNLACGLAGALRIDDVAPLLAIKPDYLGFRGALCHWNSRVAELDIEAFRAVRKLIPAIARTAAVTPTVESAV